MPAENDENPRGVLGTIRNATLLLDLLGRGERFHSLSALAEESGLSLATTHRVLRSLSQADLVSQDPASSRYSLGPGLLLLAGAYQGRLPLLQQLAPYLIELRDNTKATIEVALLVQGRVVVADRVTGENVTRLFRDSANVHDPTETAAGLVLLAHRGGEGTPWVAHTSEASGEFQVAVPVFDRAGRVAAALSATARLPFLGEQDQRLEEQLARQLQRAAAAIRESLGDG